MDILLLLRIYSSKHVPTGIPLHFFQVFNLKLFLKWKTFQMTFADKRKYLNRSTSIRANLLQRITSLILDSGFHRVDRCTSIMRTCVPIVTIKLISFARAEQLAGVKSTNGLNISNAAALECYSTLSPNEKILCPVGRNAFCVKEVTSSSRYSCGGSEDHPFDSWDIQEPGGLCVYKKCASQCLNETHMFDNQGESNSRSTNCCSESLCNSCGKISVGRSVLLSIAITAIAIFHD